VPSQGPNKQTDGQGLNVQAQVFDGDNTHAMAQVRKVMSCGPHGKTRLLKWDVAFI